MIVKEIVEIWTSTWTSSRSSTRECENKDVFDNLPQDKQDPINNDFGKIMKNNMQVQIIINDKVVEKYERKRPLLAIHADDDSDPDEGITAQEVAELSAAMDRRKRKAESAIDLLAKRPHRE